MYYFVNQVKTKEKLQSLLGERVSSFKNFDIKGIWKYCIIYFL